MPDKLNFTWRKFLMHGKDLFKSLLESHEFSDVTLVSDDQHIFRAHKFMLSASSPVFKTIIDNNPQNTSIFLRGIAKEELDSILQFIYLGEATVYQEKMNEFVKIAKELKIVLFDNTKDIEKSFDTVEKETKFNETESTKFISTNLTDSDPSSLSTLIEKKVSSQYLKEENDLKHLCHHCSFEATMLDDLNMHLQSAHGSVFSSSRNKTVSNLRKQVQTKQKGKLFHLLQN